MYIDIAKHHMHADTSKQQAVQMTDGPAFLPLIDGSFIMLTHDDVDGDEQTHVPRGIALSHYTNLEASHDVIFGKGCWGDDLPLSVNNAPVGSNIVVAEALKARNFESLLDFIVVLVELEVEIQGESPVSRDPKEAAATRREGREFVLEAVSGMEDRHHALRYVVADQLVKVRRMLRQPLGARSAESEVRIYELGMASSLPM